MFFHTHYIMDLRRPASHLEIAVIVLSALSLIFLLLFGLMYVIAIPMRSGEPWMLGLTALLLMFAAMPCMLVTKFQGRRREYLRCGGFPVQGQVREVTYHRFVNYGNQRHPWTVLCEYKYEGQTYAVRSTFLWREPVGSSAKVYLDQERPGQAWVDPESLV